MSDTPPGSPDNGNMWVDTTDMAVYVWYVDGTSSQWVAIGGPAGPPGPAGPSGGAAEAGPAFTYSSGMVSRIDYDSGNYKTFTYTGDRLDQVDYIKTGGGSIRKTFVYDGSNILQSITQTNI